LELYQISLFEDSLLCLERIGSADDATAVESSGAGASPSKSQGAPTVEEHLEGRPPEIRSLFNQLSTAIKELSSDILERPVHVAIFYEIDGQKFAEVILQQKQISVHLDFFDGDGHGLDVVDMDAKGVGHLWGVGPYKFVVKPNDQLKPALQLIAGALASMTGDRTP